MVLENFKGTIRYVGAIPYRSLGEADMKSIISQQWVKVGVLWHNRMRPKHFTKAGAAEYGYQPRKPGYMRRKIRAHHHSRPLEYSGELKALTAGRRIETRVFRKRSGVRIIMPHARKANLRNPASTIDMRAELTTVSDGEIVRMVDEHNSGMNTALRLFNNTTTFKT